MKTSFLKISLALILSTIMITSTEASVLSVCIQNCGQCKKMFGDFFLGQQCAEECMETMGIITPDCNKPASIRRFLGKT